MRVLRLVFVSVCGVLAALLLAALAWGEGDSPARTSAPKAPRLVVPVHDKASFDAALARAKGGETIRLAAGAYPPLTVANRRFSALVSIVGSRDVKLAGIAFLNSSNLLLKGVTVTPPATTAAKISIREGSGRIVIDGVFVDGREERVGAFIGVADGTSDVTVKNSELTNCGYAGTCIRPGATNLRILANKFYDCRSCTFIKGGGSGTLVQGNTFDLAHNVGCKGGLDHCPHNDNMHIRGGGPWTIVGNRFGDYEAGAAQVYVQPGEGNDDNPIRDLLIASNIFAGDAGLAIRIGTGEQSSTPPPKDVRIVNNTIVSGRSAALLITDPWELVPVGERPFVGNNILAKLNRANCRRGRFASNLLLRGSPCPGDQMGDARLDPTTLAPTKASAFVIDRADPRYAPERDFYGRLRKDAPDLGAIELGGRAGASSIQLNAPNTIGRRVGTLARDGWRLPVTLGLRGVDTVRARLLLRGKLLTSVSARVTGKSQHTLSVPLPAGARNPGVLALAVVATSADRSVSRSITVRILR